MQPQSGGISSTREAELADELVRYTELYEHAQAEIDRLGDRVIKVTLLLLALFTIDVLAILIGLMVWLV